MWDLNKIDTMLCFAFQDNEGPFNVEVEFFNPLKNTQEFFFLSRQEIKNISLWEEVKYISLFEEKRWRKRTL